jgi:3D (Asp-Asp-Asp) domain-containing protein
MKKSRLSLVWLFLVFILLASSGIYTASRLTNQKYTSSISQTSSSETQYKKSITPTPSPTPTIKPTPTPYTFQGLSTEKFYITFYGWPDNTPPGNEIAFPNHTNSETIHGTTGGVGSYSDPITFASDPDFINPGTIYYVPYLHKYIIMEDLCVTCVENWNNSLKHIDIWMDSGAEFKQKLVDCQNKWTRRAEFVVTQPTSSLPVDLNPIFDKQSGECQD